jgi:hypothetical protein
MSPVPSSGRIPRCASTRTTALSQPQSTGRRGQGSPEHAVEVLGDGDQFDLTGQPAGERIHFSFGVVLGAVESAVDHPLDAASYRVESRGGRHGGAGDDQVVRLAEKAGDQDHRNGIDRGNHRCDQGVGDGAGDESIDLVEPVARHGDRDRRRQRPETGDYHDGGELLIR